MRRLRTVTWCGLLLAIAVVCEQFIFTPTQFLKITLSTYPKVIAAALFGPIPGALVYGMTDVISVMTNNKGPYFPGFTLTAVLAGFIYGYAFWQQKPNIWRVAITVAVVAVFCNITLNTIWITLLYGTPLQTILLPRTLLYTGTAAADTIIVTLLWRGLYAALPEMHK